MSGIDLDGSSIRKGAVDAILAHIEGRETAPVGLGTRGGTAVAEAPTASRAAREIRQIADRIAQQGGTPLAVAKNDRLLGVIHLKDIVRAVSASASPSCAAPGSAR